MSRDFNCNVAPTCVCSGSMQLGVCGLTFRQESIGVEIR